MSDLVILSILSTRTYYDRFNKYVKDNIGKESKTILTSMGKYYDSNSVDHIDWSVFTEYFHHTLFPTMKLDVLAQYKKLFDRLSETDYDEDEIYSIVQGFIDRWSAERIMDVAMRIADGEEDLTIDDIRTELDRRDTESKSTDDSAIYNWDDIIERESGYLEWRLNELNLSLGKLGKGNFIIVGARPDSGKTTFLASEVTHFATQLEPSDTILWLNNEEDEGQVQRRVVQAALSWTREDMEDDWTRTKREYETAINGPVSKIKIVKINSMFTSQLHNLFRKHTPRLIVIDQLRKVSGFDKMAGNEVARQEMLFSWARDMAKEFCPVITVHQADGTAEGTRWIDMSQLHMSKTGIQGEADAIITIGRDPELPTSRFFNIPKNKLDGFNPEYRNGQWEVTILPEVARFKGTV